MTMTEQKSGVVRSKEFHFPVDVDWVGERRVAAHVVGKLPIEITPPPEFRGTDPSTWSPEDLFVAAAASCLAVTFTGLAQRAGLAFEGLAVAGDGVAGSRADGRFGFTGCCSSSTSRSTRLIRRSHASWRRKQRRPVSCRCRSTSRSRP